MHSSDREKFLRKNRLIAPATHYGQGFSRTPYTSKTVNVTLFLANKPCYPSFVVTKVDDYKKLVIAGPLSKKMFYECEVPPNIHYSFNGPAEKCAKFLSQITDLDLELYVPQRAVAWKVNTSLSLLSAISSGSILSKNQTLINNHSLQMEQIHWIETGRSFAQFNTEEVVEDTNEDSSLLNTDDLHFLSNAEFYQYVKEYPKTKPVYLSIGLKLIKSTFIETLIQTLPVIGLSYVRFSVGGTPVENFIYLLNKIHNTTIGKRKLAAISKLQLQFNNDTTPEEVFQIIGHFNRLNHLLLYYVPSTHSTFQEWPSSLFSNLQNVERLQLAVSNANLTTLIAPMTRLRELEFYWNTATPDLKIQSPSLIKLSIHEIWRLPISTIQNILESCPVLTSLKLSGIVHRKKDYTESKESFAEGILSKNTVKNQVTDLSLIKITTDSHLLSDLLSFFNTAQTLILENIQVKKETDSEMETKQHCPEEKICMPLLTELNVNNYQGGQGLLKKLLMGAAPRLRKVVLNSLFITRGNKYEILDKEIEFPQLEFVDLNVSLRNVWQIIHNSPNIRELYIDNTRLINHPEDMSSIDLMTKPKHFNSLVSIMKKGMLFREEVPFFEMLFRNSNVKELSFQAISYLPDSGASLTYYPPQLRRLQIEGGLTKENIRQISNCSLLEFLALQNCPIEDINSCSWSDFINPLPKLTEIIIHNTKISVDFLTVLTLRSAVKKITLSGYCPIATNELDPPQAQCFSLKYVKWETTAEVSTILKILKVWPNIQTLWIMHGAIGNETLGELPACHLPKLEKLIFNERNIQLLAALLKASPRLKALELNLSYLDGEYSPKEEKEKLLEGMNIHSLTELSLGRDFPPTILSITPNVERLSINRSDKENSFLNGIRCAPLKKLQELFLTNPGKMICKDAFQKIFPAVRRLLITFASDIDFTFFSHCNSLEHLEINYRINKTSAPNEEITNQLVTIILGLKNLKSVYLHNLELSSEARKSLLNKFPQAIVQESDSISMTMSGPSHYLPSAQPPSNQLVPPSTVGSHESTLIDQALIANTPPNEYRGHRIDQIILAENEKEPAKPIVSYKYVTLTVDDWRPLTENEKKQIQTAEAETIRQHFEKTKNCDPSIFLADYPIAASSQVQTLQERKKKDKNKTRNEIKMINISADALRFCDKTGQWGIICDKADANLVYTFESSLVETDYLSELAKDSKLTERQYLSIPLELKLHQNKIKVLPEEGYTKEELLKAAILQLRKFSDTSIKFADPVTLYEFNQLLQKHKAGSCFYRALIGKIIADSLGFNCYIDDTMGVHADLVINGYWVDLSGVRLNIHKEDTKKDLKSNLIDHQITMIAFDQFFVPFYEETDFCSPYPNLILFHNEHQLKTERDLLLSIVRTSKKKNIQCALVEDIDCGIVPFINGVQNGKLGLFASRWVHDLQRLKKGDLLVICCDDPDKIAALHTIIDKQSYSFIDKNGHVQIIPIQASFLLVLHSKHMSSVKENGPLIRRFPNNKHLPSNIIIQEETQEATSAPITQVNMYENEGLFESQLFSKIVGRETGLDYELTPSGKLLRDEKSHAHVQLLDPPKDRSLTAFYFYAEQDLIFFRNCYVPKPKNVHFSEQNLPLDLSSFHFEYFSRKRADIDCVWNIFFDDLFFKQEAFALSGILSNFQGRKMVLLIPHCMENKYWKRLVSAMKELKIEPEFIVTRDASVSEGVKVISTCTPDMPQKRPWVNKNELQSHITIVNSSNPSVTTQLVLAEYKDQIDLHVRVGEQRGTDEVFDQIEIVNSNITYHCSKGTALLLQPNKTVLIEALGPFSNEFKLQLECFYAKRILSKGVLQEMQGRVIIVSSELDLLPLVEERYVHAVEPLHLEYKETSTPALENVPAVLPSEKHPESETHLELKVSDSQEDDLERKSSGDELQQRQALLLEKIRGSHVLNIIGPPKSAKTSTVEEWLITQSDALNYKEVIIFHADELDACLSNLGNSQHLTILLFDNFMDLTLYKDSFAELFDDKKPKIFHNQRDYDIPSNLKIIFISEVAVFPSLPTIAVQFPAFSNANSIEFAKTLLVNCGIDKDSASLAVEIFMQGYQMLRKYRPDLSFPQILAAACSNFLAKINSLEANSEDDKPDNEEKLSHTSESFFVHGKIKLEKFNSLPESLVIDQAQMGIYDAISGYLNAMAQQQVQKMLFKGEYLGIELSLQDVAPDPIKSARYYEPPSRRHIMRLLWGCLYARGLCLSNPEMPNDFRWIMLSGNSGTGKSKMLESLLLHNQFYLAGTPEAEQVPPTQWYYIISVDNADNAFQIIKMAAIQGSLFIIDEDNVLPFSLLQQAMKSVRTLHPGCRGFCTSNATANHTGRFAKSQQYDGECHWIQVTEYDRADVDFILKSYIDDYLLDFAKNKDDLFQSLQNQFNVKSIRQQLIERNYKMSQDLETLFCATRTFLSYQLANQKISSRQEAASPIYITTEYQGVFFHFQDKKEMMDILEESKRPSVELR